MARPGWEDVPAVRDGHVYEIKSSVILQPGPAALTEGVAEIQNLVERWIGRREAEAGFALEFDRPDPDIYEVVTASGQPD